MSRRGRPRSDRLALVERVAGILLAEPDLSANAVQTRVRARRRDVLRAVRALRAGEMPRERPAGRATRFPKTESGNSGDGRLALRAPDAKGGESLIAERAAPAAVNVREPGAEVELFPR
jgi:hypothetical protein